MQQLIEDEELADVDEEVEDEEGENDESHADTVSILSSV